MGANLQIVGFNDKIKTEEQALKNLKERQEQSRYMNGNDGYSGTIAELGFRAISNVFDNYNAFSDWLEDKRKGDGYLARIKVIRETKPLIAARLKAREAANAVCQARREKKAPSVIRTLTTRHNKAAERVKKIEAEQAAKSTKTRFMAGGWASE